jgi:hypothetical protein
MLSQRTVTSDLDWSTAIELKRSRAYEQVVDVTGWTLEEVDRRYQGKWGAEGVDFHAMMLRRSAEGGELIAWFEGDRMVAYAAIRVTNLCGDDGPLLCTTGDLLILPELDNAGRDQIACDLKRYGTDRDAVTFEFLCDAPDQARLECAGFRPQKVAMRFDVKG